LFLALGGYVASTSASSSSIVKDFDTKAAAVEQKINSNTNEKPNPLGSTIYDNPVVPIIPFTRYAVNHELFNITANEATRRMNPRLLAPTEAQVEFVRGSIGVFDIIEENGVRMIGVIKQRPATKHDNTKINRIRRGNNPPRPAAPTTPPPAGPAGGGGRSGAGGAGGGPGGAPGGMRGPQTEKTSEPEVQYARVDSKEIATNDRRHGQRPIQAAGRGVPLRLAGTDRSGVDRFPGLPGVRRRAAAVGG
jgi:hypothetical protein